jgi:hypothetical protein
VHVLLADERFVETGGIEPGTWVLAPPADTQ